VFVLLGVAAAWFSSRITAGGAPDHEAMTRSGAPVSGAVKQDPAC
jgi:hypothetical protein